MSYDPSFENTASCKSSVTFIDGDKGILRYRGYPIEQLAEKSSQLEVSKLLIDLGCCVLPLILICSPFKKVPEV